MVTKRSYWAIQSQRDSGKEYLESFWMPSLSPTVGGKGGLQNSNDLGKALKVYSKGLLILDK